MKQQKKKSQEANETKSQLPEKINEIDEFLLE